MGKRRQRRAGIRRIHPGRSRFRKAEQRDCCSNDGTRPVIFKIGCIDIPENDEEGKRLAKQDFSNSAEDAYSG